MTEKQIRRYTSPRIETGPHFPDGGDFRVLFLNTNSYSVGVANGDIMI